MLALQVAYISIPRHMCVPPINATKTNWNYLSCHCNAPSGHPQYLPTCFLLCITHEVAEEFFNQLKRSRCNTHNFSPEAMFQNHPFSGLYLSGQCRLSTQSPHCLQSWNFPPGCAQFRRGMWIVLHSFWGKFARSAITEERDGIIYLITPSCFVIPAAVMKKWGRRQSNIILYKRSKLTLFLFILE